MSELDELEVELAGEFSSLLPGLDQETRANLVRVASLSDFFCKQVRRDPAVIAELVGSGALDRDRGDTLVTLDERVDHTALDAALRRTRNREMVRIIYRDLMGLSDLEETTRDLSNLADGMIGAALDVHYRRNCERLGTPISRTSGEPQAMTVLALGKLGARELNLSSDIDLIFMFGESGTVDGERDLSNEEFFTRTARSLIASLDHVTEDGFVFRVDMRLRPYGDSGALLLNRNAMEKYYLEQGREWERYAFIKGRACAGDLDQGEDFLGWLTPFVYRKHLDFGAIDSLREMKRLINYEVDVKGLADDLKLGHGGIREVEFVVQAYQLIWGGNEVHLRERRLLRVLEMLARDELMPREHASAFDEAYRFLRDSEHVVQAESDRQTQALPTTPLSQARLARAMGFEDFNAYLAVLNRHRQAVRDRFNEFMSANRSERETQVEENRQWVTIWQSPESAEAIELLRSTGFADPERIGARLTAFERELDVGDVQEIGVERIGRLMPTLLSLVAREENPDETLERLFGIIDSIARRSTYVSYLLENFDALKRTVILCAMSPWVAERLQSLPILLYELSDRVTEDQVFDRDRLTEEMRQLIQNLEPGDLEAQMDSLRQFKNSAVLKVAVFELLDLLPVMKASDALTEIAEIVINRAFELAWAYLVQRHGTPLDRDGNEIDRAFGVIAYGKLGGIELGYGSDLDVVFLHDGDTSGRTDGERSIENGAFFVRLGQRMIHILSSMTRFGVLYEIDLRLRPDGNAGPLVTGIGAYEKYLMEKAWTWEHQALVRARFVAGTSGLEARFEGIRRAALTKARDRGVLLKDVVSMREKMRRHLEEPEQKPKPGAIETISDQVMMSGFDLKQGAGAIVDIEFMVQYAVLANAADYPELTRWTDKMRILDDLSDLGLFEEDEVSLLQRAYIAYRAAVHYRSLGGAMASFEQLNQFRADVVEIWNRHMQ